MLYAVIRSGRDAFHFFGEVSGYNLQTLRQHVRQTLKEDADVHLRVELGADDHEPFTRHTRRWLPNLADAGVSIEVITPDGVRHTPRREAARHVA